MNTRLVTTIIIICSFFTGLYAGILLGRDFEKKEKEQKTFLFQQQIDRIG
jgi:hypothetical protein